MDESVKPSGRAALVRALNVSRNAKWGFLFSFATTAAVLVFFVVIPEVDGPPVLYVALAFVLVVSLGGLATAVLTLVSMVRLARES